MAAIIFDGKSFAQEKEVHLKAKVQELSRAKIHLKIAVLVFLEDEGSLLYTDLKRECAQRVGIMYQPTYLSLREPTSRLCELLRFFSHSLDITGVMVQKPTKKRWVEVTGGSPDEFQSWWETLTLAIDPQKDVDCLTPTNLQQVARSTNTILPATVKACVEILRESKKTLHYDDTAWKKLSVLVIGRSDIVGKPLAFYLSTVFSVVTNIGKKELQATPTIGCQYDIVICAVGVSQLITASMIKPKSIVIDVGSPQNDIDRKSVEQIAAFLTPVPGGVGPVTVVSLMENAVACISV